MYLTDGLKEADLEPRLVGLEMDESDLRQAPAETDRVPIPKVIGAEEIIVHDGYLYGIDSPNLFKFDLTTSKLSWLREIDCSHIAAVENSLLLVEDFGKLMALDTETGSVVWTYSDVSDATVAYVDRSDYQ